VPQTSVDLQQKSFPVSPSDGGSITATEEESAAEVVARRLDDYTSSLQAGEPAAPSIAQQVGFGPLLERREKEASWEDERSETETIAHLVEPLCPYRDDSISDQHNIHHLSTERSIHHLSTEHNTHQLSTVEEEHQRLQAALGVANLSGTSSIHSTPVYPSGPTWPETVQSFNGEQDPVQKYLTDTAAMAHSPRHSSNLPMLPYSPPYANNGQTQCSHGCSGVADTTSGYHGTPMVGNSWPGLPNNTHVTIICLPVMFAPQACCSQAPSQYGMARSFYG
jgi:hypothetical protein